MVGQPVNKLEVERPPGLLDVHFQSVNGVGALGNGLKLTPDVVSRQNLIFVAARDQSMVSRSLSNLSLSTFLYLFDQRESIQI